MSNVTPNTSIPDIPDAIHMPEYQMRNILGEIKNKRPITGESKKSDSFKSLFDTIKEVLDAKNGQYSIDPISVLSTDDLLCQIKIKAVRAQLVNMKDKRIDELTDIIVYSLLTWKKIIEESHE